MGGMKMPLIFYFYVGDGFMKPIIVNFSHYVIPEYEIGDCTRLERQLSIFDNRYYQLRPIGLTYDEDEKELRIPRGFPEKYLSSLLGRTLDIRDKAMDSEKMKINLLQEPREKLQTEVISFLCGGSNKYQYTKRHTQLFCDLNTGKGKTYCATAAMSYFKQKTVVFTPSRISKVSDQWLEGILAATDKRKQDILIVTGSKMCLGILEGKYENVDVFIFNRATVLSFAKTYGWRKFQEMIEKTKAGIKIVDEAHLDFATNVKIDCYTNIKRNWYLTSSAGRGSIDEDKIFKNVFDTVPILGKEFTTIENNHIVMLVFKFSHVPTTKQRLGCKTKEGLSSALYSNYLMDKAGARTEFFNTLNHALKTIFVKYKDSDGKLLILGASRELLRTISKFLAANYPQYSVGMYTSDIDRKVREKELSNDIILGTEKGVGTGADIKDLQFMINLIPYSNKIYADQLPGRLRNNGRNVFYMELVNTGFPEASNQFDNRVKHLGKKAKQGKIISVEYSSEHAVQSIPPRYNRNDNGCIRLILKPSWKNG
jgi:hypothetical protein